MASESRLIPENKTLLHKTAIATKPHLSGVLDTIFVSIDDDGLVDIYLLKRDGILRVQPWMSFYDRELEEIKGVEAPVTCTSIEGFTHGGWKSQAGKVLISLKTHRYESLQKRNYYQRLHSLKK